MTKAKAKLILVGVLGVVVVVLGVYRLRGGGPAPAEAAVVPPAPTAPSDALAGIATPEQPDAWSLPESAELEKLLLGSWVPPASDPFVMSARIRRVAEGVAGRLATEGEGEPAQTPDDSPSFHVRSTYAVGNVWYAEIDDRSYGVGDVVSGFVLLQITDRAVCVSRLTGDTSAETPAVAPGPKPSCVIRAGAQVVANLDGRWLVAGDMTSRGVVEAIGDDCVIFDSRAGPSMRDSDEELELKVGDGL